MTRRITAGFLAVLLALIAAVVVPLGINLSSQERHDFQRSAHDAARAMAALAEEHLADQHAPGTLSLPTRAGDGVVVLDRHGNVVGATGHPVDRAVIDRIRGRGHPHTGDTVIASATVGDTDSRDGTVILVRNAAPVDHRVHALWVTLAAAAAAALAVGALLAVGLARWIGRPLEELRAAAAATGRGDTGARARENSGPPEIRTLAFTFNDMSERLGALLHTQRLMTSDVSHQLRTPLSALRLRLELLAEDVGETQRAELDGALREIARLSRLADGLLAVARAEQTTTTPEPVDVTAVVHDRVELWSPLANERGATLTTHLSPACALATPGHLEQVLDNCLANALDAVDFGDRIDVTVHTESSSVVLNIIDNGAGMPEDQRKTAFTRFASDRNRPGNTGLGLTIVASLVAADHGTTSLRPTPGGGLTAIIGLPAAAPAPAVTDNG